MEICNISDTHTYHRDLVIPKCDVLIHAGDLTWKGEEEHLRDFNEWAKELKEEEVVGEVVVIGGNHDLTLEDNPEVASKWLDDCEYLNNSETYVGPDPDNLLCVYGCPWTLRFYDWGFNCNEKDLAEYLSHAPMDTDILVTHGPPKGYVDTERHGMHCGSMALYDFIMDRQPKLVVCGHIHEGYGLALLGHTLVINASSCTRDYNPSNQPVLIEL